MDFGASVGRCCNIESLEISASLPIVDEFFRSPKPKLTKLRLAVAGTTADYSAVVGHIAENTGGLRDLCLMGPIIETAVLQKLVDANRSIESVNFPHYNRRVENAAEDEALYAKYVTNIVSVCSKCAELRNLSFSNMNAPMSKIPAVADACGSLRLRDVSVTYNTKYL